MRADVGTCKAVAVYNCELFRLLTYICPWSRCINSSSIEIIELLMKDK